MKYRLYHVAFEPAAVMVAEFESNAADEFEALERLYKATQNVTANWVVARGQFDVRVEPSATVKAAGGCRSTSVGDYVVVDNSRVYECACAGWRRVAGRPAPRVVD